MKSNITTILPIALAIILPGLSLYSNTGGMELEGIEFYYGWLVASIILFLLWHLLWRLWDVQSSYKRWGIIVGFFVFFGAMLGLLSWFDFSRADGLILPSILRIILAVILILAIQYALKAQQNISRLLVEKEQVQTENYRVQLKSLQAKIDPHFLFNSLNTLRSMVRQQHANSEQFVISLSDFYRQTLEFNENTTLPLSEELAVLQSYLFLMQRRHEEAVAAAINIDPSLHHLHLPTLALQIVVENCFKHNSMSSKTPLRIDIKNTADHYIEISNNIQARLGDHPPSGHGLALLRKRYELMNEQQGVIVEETPKHFSVKLKLL